MNRSDITLDFIAQHGMNEELAKKFQKLGTLKYIAKRKQTAKCYIRDLIKILKEGHYDVLHVHGNSGTMIIETVLAKIFGVKKIIIHCHNTTCAHPVINAIMKTPMIWLSSECLACSEKAGRWLYGKKKYTVLNNAINLSRFGFNVQNREAVRNEFGIGDETLIGHIGHFHEQKNHKFLIDIFAAYHIVDPKAKLMLISDGPRLQQIKDKVHQLGLEDVVIFAGRRSDADRIYSSFDLFLLPSLWEGLPVVMMEAQANGLPLLVADTITLEAKCTDRIYYKRLEDGAESWADQIKNMLENGYDREADMSRNMKKYRFDISEEAEVLRSIYLR